MVLLAGWCFFSYYSLVSGLQSVWKNKDILVFSLKVLDCASVEEHPCIPVAAIVTGEWYLKKESFLVKICMITLRGDSKSSSLGCCYYMKKLNFFYSIFGKLGTDGECWGRGRRKAFPNLFILLIDLKLQKGRLRLDIRKNFFQDKIVCYKQYHAVHGI